MTREPPPRGVAFPLVGETRSTTATSRAVVAAAAATVDPHLARRIEAEQHWHTAYATHLRDLVVADLVTSDASRQLPRAGLDELRSRLTFRRGDDEVPLARVFDLPDEVAPDSVVIEGHGRPSDPPLTVPYQGRALEGDALRRQLARWTEAGTVEPSFATAIERILEQPEWLDLRGRTFVLFGAGAEMGPIAPLCRRGATVVPVDLPDAALWRRVLGAVRAGSGRAIVPLHRPPRRADDAAVAAAAGIDLVTGVPELGRWLERLEGPITVGTYTYADGAAHVLVSMAADAMVDHLLTVRDDVTVACLLTPTDVYAAPHDAVEQAQRRFVADTRLRSATRAVTGGRAFAPNYEGTVATPDGDRFGIADCLVRQQGPNYALAKRAQRWRVRAARDEGVPVSANIAPATRTRSILSNRVLAAAYAGAPRYGVEIFDPATSTVLMAALLARDLADPEAPGNPKSDVPHPLAVFADAAAHGGLWRQPYSPRTVLPAAAMRGLLPRRSRPVAASS